MIPGRLGKKRPFFPLLVRVPHQRYKCLPEREKKRGLVGNLVSGPPSPRMPPPSRWLRPLMPFSTNVSYFAFRLRRRRFVSPLLESSPKKDEEMSAERSHLISWTRREEEHIHPPRPAALDGFEFSPRFRSICVTRSTLIQGYWTCAEARG